MHAPEPEHTSIPMPILSVNSSNHSAHLRKLDTAHPMFNAPQGPICGLPAVALLARRSLGEVGAKAGANRG